MYDVWSSRAMYIDTKETIMAMLHYVTRPKTGTVAYCNRHLVTDELRGLG